VGILNGKPPLTWRPLQLNFHKNIRYLFAGAANFSDHKFFSIGMIFMTFMTHAVPSSFVGHPLNADSGTAISDF
jgi:hypothetical protein